MLGGSHLLAKALVPALGVPFWLPGPASSSRMRDAATWPLPRTAVLTTDRRVRHRSAGSQSSRRRSSQGLAGKRSGCEACFLHPVVCPWPSRLHDVTAGGPRFRRRDWIALAPRSTFNKQRQASCGEAPACTESRHAGTHLDLLAVAKRMLAAPHVWQSPTVHAPEYLQRCFKTSLFVETPSAAHHKPLLLGPPIVT